MSASSDVISGERSNTRAGVIAMVVIVKFDGVSKGEVSTVSATDRKMIRASEPVIFYPREHHAKQSYTGLILNKKNTSYEHSKSTWQRSFFKKG